MLKKSIAYEDMYFRLMRLHSLTGAWLLMWPCLWSVLLLLTDFVDLCWIPFFMIGAIVMRSLGCIVNDIADRDIDGHVARTAQRPLVVGLFDHGKIVSIMVGLSVVGFIFLLLLGKKALMLGLFVALLIMIYPFSKRFFYYPQFLLATIYSTGALFGSLAIKSEVTFPAMMLYVGCLFWVMLYDTVYSHQDKEYDAKMNLKTMALSRFGKKNWLSAFANLAILFWALAGSMAGQGILFYFVIMVVFILLRKKLASINLDDPSECMGFFRFNHKVGWLIFIGLALGKAAVLTY